MASGSVELSAKKAFPRHSKRIVRILRVFFLASVESIDQSKRMVSRVCKKVLTSLKRIALYISLITGLVGIGTVFHSTNRLHIHRRLPRESNITEWMVVSTDSELERINTLVIRRFSDDVEFFDPVDFSVRQSSSCLLSEHTYV
ncbi:hypothetical protein Y032_0134g1830 [Ancylostoma ceylanicum]|nr:hypothetical protein Y032_0134g1830 [Ancylostoma ceylanicum]